VYLDTDDPDSILSRLADEMEEAQLGNGREVLTAARQLLGDPEASRAELRFTAARLAECLFDALRVADSRGERLADDEEDDTDEDDDEEDDADEDDADEDDGDGD
jgi:hypothetical protein